MDLTPYLEAMRRVFADAPYGVEHTLRVLAHTEAILSGEGASAAEQDVARLAAVLHDTGALEALRLHGSMDGPYQEREGERMAREILARLGAAPRLLERVVYIVAHHHTPARVDGLDFMALWDADWIDGIEYGDERYDRAALEAIIEGSLRTETGKRIAREQLLEEDSTKSGEA